MKVLLTGATGFLGWHTRARLRALTDHEVLTVERANWADLGERAMDVDAIVHIAGVNRAADDAIERDNIAMATAVAEAASRSRSAPRIVFANSIRCGDNTSYGSAKARAGEVLESAAARIGSTYVDVRLPNLFGEHGRPGYNSFVATFAHDVVSGRLPEVADRELRLLHAQQAAESLIDGLTTQVAQINPIGTTASVGGVLSTLRNLWEIYVEGDLPDLAAEFERDLFNTLRAAAFPAFYPIRTAAHSDARGRLVETVRSHGGQGQAFISTTRPGATRGEHFHLHKFERFVLVSGSARISLRRLFTDRVISFDVSGDDPVLVDMPTLWAHNITNVGSADSVTMFWASDLFDPNAPDTYPEPVGDPPANEGPTR